MSTCSAASGKCYPFPPNLENTTKVKTPSFVYDVAPQISRKNGLLSNVTVSACMAVTAKSESYPIHPTWIRPCDCSVQEPLFGGVLITGVQSILIICKRKI